jgi:upstream activation factor subunit UAF30
MPSEQAIRKKMEQLVPTVDLETMTTKQFIANLSKDMGGVDFSSKRKFIKRSLTEILDAMDDSDDGNDSDSSEEEVKEPPKKKRRGGLTAVKEISEELASFLGKGKEMARTEVVKGLWDYIKANKLQNPKDKREIILDDKMKALFNIDRFTMFQMNKYIGSHIHPFKKVNLDELSENSKKKKQEAAERRKAKMEAKKAGKKNSNVTRKPGTQAPYRLSDELVAVVGKEILPRPQVTQKLWLYIKKHGLQVSDSFLLNAQIFILSLGRFTFTLFCFLTLTIESKRQTGNHL